MTDGTSFAPFTVPPMPYWARTRNISISDEFVPRGAINGINFSGTHQEATKLGSMGYIFVDDEQNLDSGFGYAKFTLLQTVGQCCYGDPPPFPPDLPSCTIDPMEITINEQVGNDLVFSYEGNPLYIDVVNDGIYRFDFVYEYDILSDICNPPPISFPEYRCWEKSFYIYAPYLMVTARSKITRAAIKISRSLFTSTNPIGCGEFRSHTSSSTITRGFMLLNALSSTYIQMYLYELLYSGWRTPTYIGFQKKIDVTVQRLNLTPV